MNLTLTLKKEFFNQIRAGKKTIEYRLDKPYWQSRLLNKDGTFKKLDKIIFRNGYHRDAPKIIAKHIKTERTVCPDVLGWKGKPCFAIKFELL